MANIKDIAKACGVAVSTVSYALNDNEIISLETRERIKKVAKEMGYVPNSYARSLKSNKTYKVGIFLTDFGGTIHPAMLHGMDMVFSESEYDMVATISNEKMTLIKDKSVDLAILIDSRISREKVLELNKYCPLIVYDKMYRNVDLNYVLLQNEEAVYQETKYLISLGLKKIAFIFGPHSSLHNQERFMGYVKALDEADINPQGLVYDAGTYVEESGYKVISRILSESDELPFEAIIASNDELAFGALKALNVYGYEVPRDCLLAGFDNTEKSSLINPSLTTINVDWIQCGVEIAKYALDILQNKTSEKVVKLNAELILRDSTDVSKMALVK